MLRPGVGQLVQRSGQAHRCGSMTGRAMAANKLPNSRDPSRTSIRFIGDCIAILHDGQVRQAGEFFFPGTLTRIIEASLALSGPGVPFSVEIWCEPDTEGRPRSPLGYSYVAYNCRPRAANDPVLALAIASGFIELPAGDGGTLLLGANGAQAHGDDVDPETGEVVVGDTEAPSDKSSLVGTDAPSQSASKVSGKQAAAA
jgi:hypothetical protein